MKTWVIAVLLATALGSPVPDDDDDCEFRFAGTGTDSKGYHQHTVTYSTSADSGSSSSASSSTDSGASGSVSTSHVSGASSSSAYASKPSVALAYSAPTVVTPSISVKDARAQFMSTWRAAAAAAAAAPDVNIIMGASHRRQPAAAITYSAPAPAPASYSYSAAPLRPVGPTPDVQRATAEFMAAWNTAAARATRIESTLVRSTPTGAFTVHLPQQVQETEEVRKATEEFMAAYNKAAQRAVTVEHAALSLPRPVKQTAEVQRATASFMASFEAAARQASAIRQAVTYSAQSHSPVKPTEEVRRATEQFMMSWNEAAARVRTIQPTIYRVAGAAPSEAPRIVGGVPQFTISQEKATADFMKIWRAAAAAAEAAPDVNIIMGAGHYSQPAAPAAPVVYSAPAAAPAPVSYSAAPLRPVGPTLDVQRATAEFMAAWNTAAARATRIESSLVRTTPTGAFTVHLPQQVRETEEVRKATEEFMAAYNKVAQRAVTVEHAALSLPRPVKPTAEVQRATASFMASFEAAARQASAIRQAVTYSAQSHSPVKPTEEVRIATEQFMRSWNEAAARVRTIQPTIYRVAGAAPSSEAPRIVGGVPQFTISQEKATADFMKIWRAAAAAAEAAPDVNIIMGASQLRQPAAPVAPAVYTAPAAAPAPAPVSVAYSAAPLRPVGPTPEVQRATAEFMAAWNTAAARATQIESTLVRSTPTGAFTVQLPQQVQVTEEVRRATEEFMAAYNKAAHCAVTVEHAALSLPRPVQPTAEVQRATASFMASFEAAARQASAIRQAVTYSAQSHSQVKPTEEVRIATEQFMRSWNEAAARVRTIQPTIYRVAGAAPSSEAPRIVGGVPQFTISQEKATADFMKIWRAAAAAAEAAPDVNIIMGASQLRQPAAPVAPVVYTAPAAAPAPAPVSYSAAPLRPVGPTLDVQRATAEFMAAWNAAAARATQIESTLVRSTPTGAFTVHLPQQVQETEEVRRATEEFMAAYNKAAQRAVTVEHAALSLPRPVQPTAEVQRATASFMASFEAAARQASAIRQAVTYSAQSHSQVKPTEEVRIATEQFMRSWNEAAARVRTIQPTIYRVAGAAPSEAPRIVGGVPQFTISQEKATADFMKIWRAAAAAAEAAPDVNIIMGASHYGQPAAPAAPVVYSAPAAAPVHRSYSAGPLRPVGPTLEVQRATAEFMAAWNAAAERAAKIPAVVGPGGVQATAAVRQATQEFMATWNVAARRGSVVEQVISSSPMSVQATPEVQKATAEFMAAWRAAAERASRIQQTYSAVTAYSAPMQWPAADVEKATEEFMVLWNEAAARVPKIESTLYSIAGTQRFDTGVAPVPVSDTPEVKAARAAFMVKFRAAERAAARASTSRGILPAPTVIPAHLTYTVPAHAHHTVSDRIFAPFSGQPIYLRDCAN